MYRVLLLGQPTRSLFKLKIPLELSSCWLQLIFILELKIKITILYIVHVGPCRQCRQCEVVIGQLIHFSTWSSTLWWLHHGIGVFRALFEGILCIPRFGVGWRKLINNHPFYCFYEYPGVITLRHQLGKWCFHLRCFIPIKGLV